jgi:hypothetical protein
MSAVTTEVTVKHMSISVVVNLGIAYNGIPLRDFKAQIQLSALEQAPIW